MNRILVTSSLALSLGLGVAFAQQAPDASQAVPPQPPAAAGGPQHHAPDPHRQAAFLTKKLNLTPDQTAKVEPILADRDQKVQALRENQQLTPEDRHQQMRSINEQVQQQMAGVLTPDQMTQLKAMRHEHRGHPGEEAPVHPGPGL